MLDSANMANMHRRVVRRRINASLPPQKVEAPETTKEDIQDPVVEGQEEVIKENVKEEIQHTEKLDQLLNNSTKVLYQTKTIFPFVFFPHRIIITLSDVTVEFGQFFTSKEIRTVSISKIAEVIVTTGVLFAQLKLIDIDYSQLTMEIDFLGINDAMKAKRLIQGLIFAAKEGVDLTKVNQDDLKSKLEDLGRVQGESLDEKEYT